MAKHSGHNGEESVKELMERWWTEVRIKTLLDNGIDYYSAQDRDDFIGKAIRDHPRWKGKNWELLLSRTGKKR